MRLIIFTYAPTGLGHLRVTDALVGARPKDTKYVILGSYDRFMTWIHRFTSINPLGKFIFVSSQYGIFEDVFMWLYRIFMRLSLDSVYKQIADVININQNFDDFLIVATHPGMAHQIGVLKERLIKETGKKINFVVQVTDDTYQHIWLVRGADLTIVPSHFVKDHFEKYAKEQGVDFISEVIPYPIDVTLTEKLPSEIRRVFAFMGSKIPINIVFPISGAAVGLPYVVDLLRNLAKISTRFNFWVLVRKAMYTDMFVSVISEIPRVNIITGKNDNEMIHLYELIYKQNLIHLEMTKPSEQAFKAIIEPNMVGGSILLFAAPIGRQEYENVDFLHRHNLVEKIGDVTVDNSLGLRALILGGNSMEAARDIYRCITSGVFRNMTSNDFKFSAETIESGEVGANGASRFWQVVTKYFG